MAVNLKPRSVIALPTLPWEPDALEPMISAKTIEIHHGKHHRTYVDKLNEAIAGTDFAGMSLEDIVRATAPRPGKPAQPTIFNNAAQAWNHTFFWACLSPKGGAPKGQLATALERDLGGYEMFKDEFVKAGAEHFGSGWVWLVLDKGKLSIETGHDAVTPLAQGKTCILTIDLWEHAYYLDYQNNREGFLKQVSEKLLNWDFARQNFERAG
jgi:Fe-Mn family superoxide dismutase